MAVLAACSLLLTRWSLWQVSGSLSQSADAPFPGDPPVPRQGIDKVLVRPGSPPLLAPPLRPPNCLFAYGPHLAQLEQTLPARRSKDAEGWVYGALLRPGQELASPSGHQEDLLHGRLLCFARRELQRALQQADEVHPDIHPAAPVRRGVVAVVRRDGKVTQAQWHYQDQRQLLSSNQSYPSAKRMQAMISALVNDYEHFPNINFSHYAADIEFQDPTIKFKGIERYRKIVGLMGRYFGQMRQLLHRIEQTGNNTIRTEWTVNFKSPFAPWRPSIVIPGQSFFVVGADGLVHSHHDVWNTTVFGVFRQHLKAEFEPAPPRAKKQQEQPRAPALELAMLDQLLTALKIERSQLSDSQPDPRMIQMLYSGRGYIARHVLRLTPGPSAPQGKDFSFIIKYARLPANASSMKITARRDRESYLNEAAFYQLYAERVLSVGIPVPRPYLVRASREASDLFLVLEDVDSRYPRAGKDIPGDVLLSMDQAKLALRWMAKFHAFFWRHGSPGPAEGLAAQGTYWYLDTRHKELAGMESGWNMMQALAGGINWRLKIDPAQTMVHGDPKGHNIQFAFTHSNYSLPVLFYDMQYVGQAVPMKDVVHFMHTSLNGGALREHEGDLLRHYHGELMLALKEEAARSRWTECDDSAAIEKMLPFETHLMPLYELCLLDWVRFMVGWGWWGGDIGWTRRRAQGFLDKLVDQLTAAEKTALLQYGQKLRQGSDPAQPMAGLEVAKKALLRAYPLPASEDDSSYE